MRRALRAALAGATAAAVWAAADPALRRACGSSHGSVRLVGGLLAPGRRSFPVGLAAHLANGAVFGVAFDRLGGRGIVGGVIAAEAENAVLWPGLLVIDRLHPDVRSGAWPPMFASGRALAHEAAGHAVFGAVLGALAPRT